MLTYLELILYYVLPPTIVLYLLMRPFLSKFDEIKLAIMTAFGVIYAALWENHMIYQKAWWYSENAVIARIGYMPIEEYLFASLSIVFVTLWTTFCARFHLHSLSLKCTSQFEFQTIRLSVTAVLTIAMYVGWIYAIPSTRTFYMGSMLWSYLFLIIVLWYTSGSYVCKRWKVTLISVIVPSIYLCTVNVIGVRAPVWHVNQINTLEIFLVNDLLLEDFMFFFLTSSLIVIASHAIDKSKAVFGTYSNGAVPITSNISIKKQAFCYAKMLVNGLFCDVRNLDQSIIDDIEVCSNILRNASKSFSLGISCFPNGKIK